MDMIETGKLGKRLQDYRHSIGLTQQDLADQTGVSARTIRNLELGATQRPHPATTRRLLRAMCLDETPQRVVEAGVVENNYRRPAHVSSPRHSYDLPVQRTTLLGRENEVASLVALVQRPSNRMLTLTGPGGVGKTRVAIKVAEVVKEKNLFADGVAFVDLSPLRDASLVASTIASCLRLEGGGPQSSRDIVLDYLREKHLLLILDNYEHVLSSAAVLTDLLDTAPDVKVVVTSREPLHLGEEREYPVPPLLSTLPRRALDRASIAGDEGVQLFIERAQAIRPDFALTDANAATIAAICTRLDGLPLAIELAAGRVKVLPPDALLARLDKGLPLLTGGAQDAPERLQTMQRAIAWSYDLLDEAQRTLFRQLSVFSGGCTLDAIESVCVQPSDRDIDVLERLASLVDKSLVRQVEQCDNMPRFVLLKTIHEYANDQLDGSADNVITRDHHARYYLLWANKMIEELEGPDRHLWLARLEREHDNLRAALWWLQKTDAHDVGLELAITLFKFWYHRGYLNEGRYWLESFLAHAPSADAVRAQASNALGVLAANQGDYAHATLWLQSALGLYRALGNTARIASMLNNLGCAAMEQGFYNQAQNFFEESLALKQDLNNPRSLACVLGNLGSLSSKQGEYTSARAQLDGSLLLARQSADEEAASDALVDLGLVSYGQGEYARARKELEDGLATAQAIDYQRVIPQALGGLGRLASVSGDHAAAATLCTEAVAISSTVGDMEVSSRALQDLAVVLRDQGANCQARDVYLQALSRSKASGLKASIAACLEGLGVLVAADGDGEGAARLWGAADALRITLQASRSPIERVAYDASVLLVRDLLGSERFKVLWDEGTAMTLDESCAYAAN